MNTGPAVQEAGVPFVALNFSVIYIVPYFQPYIAGLETNKRNVTVIEDLVELNVLTLRRLMSYIYMEHPFLMFLDHTQRRSTVGRTPLDE